MIGPWSPGEDGPIEVAPNRVAVVVAVAGCTALAGVGLLFVLSGPLPAVVGGAVTMLLFGGLGVLVARMLLADAPLFVVEGGGIRLRDGFLTWSDVESVAVYRRRYNLRYLGLRIADREAFAATCRDHDPARVVGRLDLNRALSGYDLSFAQLSLDRRVDTIVEECTRRMRRAR